MEGDVFIRFKGATQDQRKEKSIYGTECKAIKCKQNQNLSVAEIKTR
jgi:hypothetical protein